MRNSKDFLKEHILPLSFLALFFCRGKSSKGCKELNHLVPSALLVYFEDGQGQCLRAQRSLCFLSVVLISRFRKPGPIEELIPELDLFLSAEKPLRGVC